MLGMLHQLRSTTRPSPIAGRGCAQSRLEEALQIVLPRPALVLARLSHPCGLSALLLGAQNGGSISAEGVSDDDVGVSVTLSNSYVTRCTAVEVHHPAPARPCLVRPA
jgi:hypothetical protein